MKKIVKKVVATLTQTVERNNISIADFKPSDDEVIQISGSFIWTSAVMEALSEATGTNVNYLNLTGMTESRLFGDVQQYLCFRLMDLE